MSRDNQIKALKTLRNQPIDEPAADAMRKRQKRSEAARVFIPEPQDYARREACLLDPERFLRTYFPSIFYNDFAAHHKRMIQAIYDRAWTGGDKAIAAPRGDGKTQVAIGMTIYCFHATPIRFPVLIASTSAKAKKLFDQVKSKYENEAKFPAFFADFPEVTACVKGLEGAPQRAAKQHHNNMPTRIVWSQNLVVMPRAKVGWDTNAIGGKRLVYFGLDTAIRGEGYEEDRPDLAIVDDPETREVAFSPTAKYGNIEAMIDGDVAGLSGPDKRMARVVITTLQNSYSYSATVTDPAKKPAFSGERYGQLSSYPDRMDLWDEYIAMRQADQANGDRDGQNALQFYLNNQNQMQAGSVISNPHRFVATNNEHGNPVEIDALQAFFNRVSDWGWDAVLAELQNDPREEDKPETTGLTAGIVASRMSGRVKLQLPTAPHKVTVGIDIGKYKLDWVKVAFEGNAVGTIVDHGEWAVSGTAKGSSEQFVERAIFDALQELRSQLVGNGAPDLVFVDAGAWPTAIYEFVRSAGLPFVACKGSDLNRMQFSGENTRTRQFFDGVRADIDPVSKVRLFKIDAPHWKEQVHQRFLTPTFNDLMQFNDGALSLWSTSDPKEHLQFATQIVAEELTTELTDKGLKKIWKLHSKDNHKLDATSLALAAAGCLGVRVIPREKKPQDRPKMETRKQEPNRFRQRQGGWIPKRRY